MKKDIFYITIDAERAIGLHDLLEHYHIICYYNNHTYRMLKKLGYKVLCIEDQYGEIEPIRKNSNAILNDTYVQEYIREHSTKKDTYIQVFKISRKIEETVKNLGYTTLNTSAELNRKFERKISQYQFLSAVDVNIPGSITGVLSEVEYKTVKNKIGEEFVVQFDRGHTGTNTYFIKSEKDFDSLKRLFPQRAMKLSEQIQGEPWTMNCVATNLGTFYSALTYQITGLSKLTNSDGATVGNDWTKSANLKEYTVKQIKDIADKIGSKMYGEGYKGMFGLDFIVAESGEVSLIEINARQPASTGMDTQIIRDDGGIPLSLLHAGEFLSDNRADLIKFINNSLGETYSKEELIEILRSQNQVINKSYNYSQFYIRNKYNKKSVMHFRIPSGYYHSNKVANSDGFGVTKLTDKQLYLTTAQEGRTIKPGSEVARIQIKGSCLRGEKLDTRFNQLIEKVDRSYSPDDVEKLPESVTEQIDKYFNLNLGGKEVRTPYHRNVKRIRAGLRVLVGKGSIEEIIDETKIFAKLRGVDLTEMKEKEIREFMQEIGIGIDCSGFVAQTYDQWLKERTGKGIGKYMHINKDTQMRRLKYYFRPIEHLDADTLTNDRNCTKVNLKDIKPGDLIRLRGAKRGFHILLVFTVSRENGELRSFRYVHSSPHYGDQNGMRFGLVDVTDPNDKLRNQKWLEVDKKTGKNYTYEGLLKEYEDNGVRRPKFSNLLR